MSNTLRSKVIRLAHQQPELRPHLLPLLKRAGSVMFEELASKAETAFIAALRVAMASPIEGWRVKERGSNANGWWMTARSDDTSEIKLSFEIMDDQRGYLDVNVYITGAPSGSKYSDHFVEGGMSLSDMATQIENFPKNVKRALDTAVSDVMSREDYIKLFKGWAARLERNISSNLPDGVSVWASLDRVSPNLYGVSANFKGLTKEQAPIARKLLQKAIKSTPLPEAQVTLSSKPGTWSMMEYTLRMDITPV